MKRTISSILDSESVPLRINFSCNNDAVGTELEERTLKLYHELETRLPNNPIGHEVLLIGYKEDSIDLFIGWVEKSDADIVMDCVESVFPESISAHLGDDAIDHPGLSISDKELKARSEKVYVEEKVVYFEDGREVTVSPFGISRFPVTVGQFQEFTEDTGYVTTGIISNYLGVLFCKNER